MKALFSTLVLICCTAAFSADLPLSSPTPDQFNTIQLAATAGLDDAVKLSTTEEYAGAIYQCVDKFGHTNPVSNKDDTKFAIRVTVPRACKLVGLFHTHPGTGKSDEFSPADVAIANQMRVVSFIYVVAQKHIREYDPAHDITYTDIRNGQNERTPGTII